MQGNKIFNRKIKYILKKSTKEQNLGKPQLLKSEWKFPTRNDLERERPRCVHTIFQSTWIIPESYMHMVDPKDIIKEKKKKKPKVRDIIQETKVNHTKYTKNIYSSFLNFAKRLKKENSQKHCMKSPSP